MSDMPKLLQCPFCHGKVWLRPIRDGYQVKCPCGAAGPEMFGGPEGWEECKASAIRVWNKRTEPTP